MQKSEKAGEVKSVYGVKLSDSIYLIDLKPMDIENFVASYVLRGNKVAIIETGPTASIERLLAGLQEIGVEKEDVDYVMVSHIHIDHAGGVGVLMRHLPNARLLVHDRGAQHLINPKKLWAQTKQVLGKIAEMYGEIYPVPEEQVATVKDGMVVDLGKGLELEVLETPGHASHELSFFEKTTRAIFPGDSAGVYLNKLSVVIPTTPAPFNLEMALGSLDRLIKMAPRRLYYTHFGEAFDAVRRLKAYMTQLKLWAELVLEGVGKGEDPAAIYERILQKDASTRMAAGFIKKHLILRRGVMMQNIRGFIKYLKAFP